MKYAHGFVKCCFVLFVVMLIVCGVWYWISDEDVNEDKDVINRKHFPRYWSFVRGIHRSPVISPHKSQWRGALVFSLICTRINGWINNREAGDLRRHRAHYAVTVLMFQIWLTLNSMIELVTVEPPVTQWVTWIGNHTPSEVWDEITYPFPHFTCQVISYSC